MKIKVLGAYGGRFGDLGTTCLQLSERILIDAGNIMRSLGEKCLDVDYVLLTHAHLDHIIDIPFMVDYTFRYREQPLEVMGCSDTLSAVKDYIMNWNIWPEFSSIRLINSGDYAVTYTPLDMGKSIVLNDFEIFPFKANHTIPTLGYIVKKEGKGFLFTADTYRNPVIWKKLNEDKEIKVLITEISYPSYMHNLAEISKHYTPKILKEELRSLKRDDIEIYVMHLKPNSISELLKEIPEVLPDVKILKDGDEIRI